MPVINYESNKFKLYAVMTVPGIGRGGKDVSFTFDVIQYSHEYELNTIPTCTMSLALGRRADAAADPNGVAAIHKAINVLKMQVPVVVYCKAKLLSGGKPGRGWPVDDKGRPSWFVIFRGQAVSGGFRRAFGDARYMLAVAHWLANMSYSSALSQQSHPTTPNAMYHPASFNMKDPTGGTFPIGAPGWVGPAMGRGFFMADTLTTDFWGGVNPGGKNNGGLKQWMTAISEQDRLNPKQINIGLAALGLVKCQFPLSAKNTDALDTLARFEPKDYGTGKPTYKLGVPFALDPHGANTGVLAENIGKSVANESFEGISSVTLWDKLAGQLHASYLYSIVPAVETAIAVPFIPGLRGPAHREYDNCDIQSNFPRALRGIGIFTGKNWSGGTGSNANSEPPPKFPGVGGWFGVCRPGMVMFKNAPEWLTSCNPSFYSSQSSPVTTPNGTSISPGIGPFRLGDSPAKIFADAQLIWNAYAQALYVYEMLKMRQGTLSGPVRFDIAPGSLVRIQAAEDKFTWNLISQKDYMYFYATVLRVSTVIDAEADRADTSFSLAHVRTEAENVDAATSICRHPLWNTIWSGCVLVDDRAFEPVSTVVTLPVFVNLACGKIPTIPDLF
jgi:hypothetical protein